jgi:hypothetical protein
MKSTQSDRSMAFDGMESIAPKHSTKFSGNQSGLKAKTNAGRGPTVGNHGTTTDSSCKPPVSGVPSLPKQGSTRDSINRGAQVRNPGGVKEMPKRGRESFDMGRGPTKGNQC